MPRKAIYGVLRGQLSFYIPLPAGATAVEFVTDLVLGFAFKIEKVEVITVVVGAGVGASRTLRVLKGASTVASTRTLALADTATVGQLVSSTITSGADSEFDDADTLTVDVPATGTAFTAGSVQVVISYRQLPQRVA